MAHSGAFGIRVISRAPPQVVYRLLADATLWKTWAGPLITRSEWEVEPGDGDGGIRRLGRAPFMVREEITAADPPHHHGYRLLSGQPVRSYTADVYISPSEIRSGAQSLKLEIPARARAMYRDRTLSGPVRSSLWFREPDV